MNNTSDGATGSGRDTVHVALGLHDPEGGYACHAGAMLASLFLGTVGPVCAHVVHNETLTPENKKKLLAIAQRFQKGIRFYPVQLSPDVHPLSGHVTQGALFRLLLPELVEADKVIYFDCDIILTLDILQMWQIDLTDRPIAAVLDPGMPVFPQEIRQRILQTGVPLQAYFNSGVIALNLACLRKKYRLFEQAIGYLRQYPDAVFHDQDALNFLFQQDYLQLDSRFNRIVKRSRPEEWHQPAVWHFAGVKPWENYASGLDMLYWKSLMLTPWQGEVLDRLGAAVSRTWKQINEKMEADQQAYQAITDQLAALRAELSAGS